MKRAAKQAEKEQNAADASRMLIEMVELFAVARFGFDGAFTPGERKMIEPSLTRLIERYGKTAEQFSVFIDPAILLIGVGTYALRLFSLARLTESAQAGENESAQAGENENAQAPEGSNGAVPLSDADLFALFPGRTL